jgi:ribosomal protein L40E
MRKCIKCFAETDEGAQICKKCGSKEFFVEKESKIKCPSCGASNSGDNKDCYSCGIHL